jgi:ribosomal protein S18 acetylase RimI-like enzyme
LYAPWIISLASDSLPNVAPSTMRLLRLPKSRASMRAGGLRAAFGSPKVLRASLFRAIITASMGPIVRSARLEDAAAIASIHIASSDDAYAPLAAEWHPADPAKRAAVWAKTLAEAGAALVLLAEDTDGTVIGFVSGGKARRTEPATELELHVIHVHPEHRGQGVGDALWSAACGEVRGSELTAMFVDTLAELRCCSFYERHGGELIERRPVSFQGAERTHVTYRWAHGVSHGTRAQDGVRCPGVK